MHIGNAFPSTYLKTSDLQGKSVNILMHSVEMDEIGGDIKPILYLQDAHGQKKDRGLVLNKTNSNIIAEMYGFETDEWAGKPITLYPARVEFQGKIVDAIRVKLESGTPIQAAKRTIQAPIAHNPRAAPAAPQQPTPNGNHGSSVDDEIPF